MTPKGQSVGSSNSTEEYKSFENYCLAQLPKGDDVVLLEILHLQQFQFYRQE